MAFQFAPLLWGAGIGALTSAATGQDPLRGALFGGATGGLLGNMEAIKAGLGSAGSMNLSTGAVPNIAANAAPVSLGSSATLPTASDIGAGFGYGSPLGSTASFLPAQQAAGYSASAGAIPTVGQSFNPYTGIYDDAIDVQSTINPYTGLYDDAYESYVDKGLIGSTNFNPVANIGASSQQTPFFGGNEVIKNVGVPEPTMWDEISPYLNVRDLGGAAALAAQYQQRPQMPTAPSGGISRGQAPQGTDVMALLQTIKQPEKKRISLV